MNVKVKTKQYLNLQLALPSGFNDLGSYLACVSLFEYNP